MDQDSDPSIACAQALCANIGPTGSIVAYHKSYENSILNELSQRVTTFHNQLIDFTTRLVDLEFPFAQQICCIPKSMGYSSIKIILPLLCPGFSYDQLAIKSGDIAIVKYWQLIHSNNKDEIKQILNELRQYCCQDTLAMVKIYETLLTLNTNND